MICSLKTMTQPTCTFKLFKFVESSDNLCERLQTKTLEEISVSLIIVISTCSLYYFIHTRQIELTTKMFPWH